MKGSTQIGHPDAGPVINLSDPSKLTSSPLHKFRRFLLTPNTCAILSLFVGSRLALLLVGLLTQIFIQPNSTFVHSWRFSAQPALNMWGVFDTDWYFSIAANGYDLAPRAHGWVNWVFFPAFPMISAALARFMHVPVFIAMLVVSNASFLSALFLLHREAEDEFDRPTAAAVVALICAMPGSYVYSSAYSESLFLLALVACLVLLRRRQWLAAGACAALATLTRNLGLGLVLPLMFASVPLLWRIGTTLMKRQRVVAADLGEGARVVIALCLPVLAIAAFAGFLYHQTGDQLAFVTGQKAWGRIIGDPLAAPLSAVLHPERLANKDLISFAFCIVSLAMLIVIAAMRRWSLLVFGAFLVLVPLSTGLTSYQRYCLVMVPLLLASASLLGRRPSALTVVLIALATVNGFMMVVWTLGHLVIA